ncbi:hypothetical protein Tco_1570411 [Tanacetum coccineum]
MRTRVVLVPTRNQSWNVGSVERLVTSKGIAVVVDAIAWWIDSGATTHVCKDRCWFKTFEPVEDGSVLYMGDEHFAPIHGKESFMKLQLLTHHNKMVWLKGKIELLRKLLFHLSLLRFYVIEPNNSVSINSIIESRDEIFDENRFSSIPRPKDIIPNLKNLQRDDHSEYVPRRLPESSLVE